MIGVILSGHGQFASGLLSAVTAIAGSQENLSAIDFLATDSSEILQAKILREIENLACDSIAIFTDIAGGTPFNQSVLASHKTHATCRVFSGTNMPLLLGFLLERNRYSLGALTKTLLSSDQTKASVYIERNEENVVKIEDGI